MHYTVSHKTKQFFFVIIKLNIVVGVSYFIYSSLLNNENLDFNTFIVFLSKNELFSTKNISFLMILSGFNWFFEILKWKNLVQSIKKISFIKALEQSLGGLTASLITPNKIGDYGAKAIYYDNPFRKQIVLLNLIGNVAQMTITILLGSLALLFFIGSYNVDINIYRLGQFSLILIIIGSFLIFGLKQARLSVKGDSIERIITFIKKEIPIKTHVLNFGLSLIRYAIFSFQFYYLLLLFNVDVDYFTAMTAICSIYLLASIIPSLALFDVVIKSGAAVFIFSYLSIDELTVLSITTLMWLLNFILPSLLGSYFVINFKLPKSDD
jgi:hypothetical protein